MGSTKASKSNITAVVSDIHIPHHDTEVWGAFKKWVADVKPSRIVVLGDFIDLNAVSSYTKSPSSSPYISPEMKTFVKEANWLYQYVSQLDVVEGNHEARFNKRISEALGYAADGLVGLTLKEQLFAMGLNPNINYYVESTKFRGLTIGQFLLRHGDKQAGRVAAKNIASIRIDKSLGESELVGHHHAMQYICRTNGKKTVMALVNPCMTLDHEYAVGAQWVRGFTILDHVTPSWVTPYPVVVNEGKFAYAGKVYSGKK